MTHLSVLQTIDGMARKTKQKKGKPAIALVVDGKNEKWYISKVKEHYPCSALRSAKIKPDLPGHKKIQELFDCTKTKLDKEYNFVILIIDLDEPLKKPEELNKFKELYGKYIGIKDGTLSDKQKKRYKWMNQLLIIINNPCLEYWYLLHYKKTTKHYTDFNALCQDLHKISELKDYSKTESYYNDSPNIYERLNENNGLDTARKNATPFESNKCKENGCSEMNKIFDYFDNL